MKRAFWIIASACVVAGSAFAEPAATHPADSSASNPPTHEVDGSVNTAPLTKVGGEGLPYNPPSSDSATAALKAPAKAGEGPGRKNSASRKSQAPAASVGQ